MSAKHNNKIFKQWTKALNTLNTQKNNFFVNIVYSAAQRTVATKFYLTHFDFVFENFVLASF